MNEMWTNARRLIKQKFKTITTRTTDNNILMWSKKISLNKIKMGNNNKS